MPDETVYKIDCQPWVSGSEASTYYPLLHSSGCSRWTVHVIQTRNREGSPEPEGRQNLDGPPH